MFRLLRQIIDLLCELRIGPGIFQCAARGLEFIKFQVRLQLRFLNLANLPEKIPFRKADFPDALKQLVKIVAAPGLFQSLVVERETFHNVFAQSLCRPDAELRAAMRFYAIANGDDCFEIVMLRLIGFSVGGSYPEFPDN